MKIDNFLLTMFQACPLKYKLRALEHWTARRKSAALGFGGALHEGLAAWYRTGDPRQALNAINNSWPDNLPVDDWRTKDKALQVMYDYMQRYSREPFKVVGVPDAPMIECTFTLDTGLTLEDGEPIEYGGIFDGLVEWDGSVYVLEHKTTSQLGSFYFNQYNPNNQITGYIWAAGKLSGQRVGGAIINAVGLYKSSPTKFERQITNRNKVQIEEWLQNVKHVCQQIRDCERRGFWPMHTPSCTQYGRCEFHDVHVLGTERERNAMLEMSYHREEWSYEDRDDGTTVG
jgi:hypothetical protein